MVEKLENAAEKEINPRSIALVTSTLYPGWRKETGIYSNDKLRGDLNLNLVEEALKKGFRTIIVDGGSSTEFLEELKNRGISPSVAKERGMGYDRRQAFTEGASLEGVDVIAWTEPEKISIAKDCLPEAVRPILDGRADIVIPKRDEAAFATYPSYQAEFEKKANKLFNEILRSHGLLSADCDDIDAWFGPRFFKNDPELLKIFTSKYNFNQRNLELDKLVKPDLWANALFIPIVAALNKGYRLMSVPVSYKHPAEQTAAEANDPEFRRKRDVQLKNIITTIIHYVRSVEGNPKGRLIKT